MRLFRPAREIRVHLSGGRPAKLDTEIKEMSRSEIKGCVLWSAGPWRCSGEWWSELSKPTNEEQAGCWDREEWDIALLCDSKNAKKEEQDTIALYRIYRDLATGLWFADATYD
jgi:hypothetical protein